MKKIFAILATAAALLTLGSCEKFEDGRPPKGAINEFERMYPDAFDVEWDYEGTHWEVSFETGSRPEGTEHEAKFDLAGNWIETKTEMLYSNVPQEIKDAFLAQYADARLEDNTVDFYQTPKGEFYRFDIILNGVKTTVDITAAGKSTVTPSASAERGFEQLAPEGEPWDIEWDFEGTYWEVEYKVGQWPDVTEYTSYFDLDGNWLATKTEVLLKNVPQNIIDALRASEYGNAYMDDQEADFFRTPENEFYRFEIEINGRDAEIDVDLNGNVTFVGYDN